MFDVVVLAGSGKSTELTQQQGVENKAFIPIHGKPMLAYVLEALKAADNIGRIVVVGPVGALAPLIEQYGILAVPEAATIPENLRKGVDALLPRQHFMIATADIPFLTPAAVNEFIQSCKPYDADLYYPIVSKVDSEHRFPGVLRTYVTLREGVFTGGNLFFMNPGKIDTALPRLDRIFSLRKSPLRLAGELGVGFIARLLLKRLTLPELEDRFSALFGLRAKAVITPHPEIGTDVDKPEDLGLAVRELQ